MFKFKRKKTERKKLFFPQDKIREVFRLYDNYASAPTNNDTLKKYELWSYIATIFPEVKNGKWELSAKPVFNPCVIRTSK